MGQAVGFDLRSWLLWGPSAPHCTQLLTVPMSPTPSRGQLLLCSPSREPYVEPGRQYHSSCLPSSVYAGPDGWPPLLVPSHPSLSKPSGVGAQAGVLGDG